MLHTDFQEIYIKSGLATKELILIKKTDSTSLRLELYGKDFF